MGQYNIGSTLWPGLSKLIEECGEVVQVAGKIIAINGASAHWDGTDLRLRIQEEIGDVIAACCFVVDMCGLDEEAIVARVEAKLATFRRWHEEQKEK